MQREICKKLEEIKEINPINYDKINRVLRFLYKTVQCDYFEKKINMSKLSEEIYHAAHIGGSSVLQQEVTSHVNLKETLFNNYIESKNGIINMLFDMAQEEDQRFFEYFINKIDVPLTMFENGINCKTESCMYVYNLYVMLRAYTGKNDFETYKIIVDDVRDLFIDKNNGNWTENNKKSLIDKIINNEFFPEIDLLRGLLIRTLTENNSIDEKDEKRLNTMFMFLKEVTRDKIKYGKLGNVGYNIKPEIFNIIASDIALLVHRDLLPGCEPFYDPIILFGDRYKVLKEEMKKVGVNHREEVYSYFVSVCPGLFDELNLGKEEDVFNECIKKIFDSDTYSELYRKLEDFSKADELYQKGNKKEAFEKIKTIMTESYKDTLLGTVLEFPTNNNNKIEKPNGISERAKALYIKHDLVPFDFNWDILESSNYSLLTLKERIETEVYDYNTSKQMALQQEVKMQVEEPKQKKKSRFNIFG